MSESEFIDLFKESFDDLVSSINSDTIYKELEEWTSMQALILIAHLDDTIGVVLSADDLKDSSSLKELYQLINEQL